MGLDSNPDACAIAIEHGVPAFVADASVWHPPAPVASLYIADGLLGHLWRGEKSLGSFFASAVQTVAPGGYILLSNDMPTGRHQEETRFRLCDAPGPAVPAVAASRQGS